METGTIRGDHAHISCRSLFPQTTDIPELTLIHASAYVFSAPLPPHHPMPLLKKKLKKTHIQSRVFLLPSILSGYYSGDTGCVMVYTWKGQGSSMGVPAQLTSSPRQLS